MSRGFILNIPLCFLFTLFLVTLPVIAETDIQFSQQSRFPGGATYVMAMSGNTLYTATGPLVEIWTVSAKGEPPQNYMAWLGTGEIKPQKIGEIQFGDNTVCGLTLDKKYLYVGTGEGLEIFNVSVPKKPQRIGSYSGELIGQMMIRNGLLYASTDFKETNAHETHKFVILDVHNPKQIFEVGSYSIPVKKGHLERFTISGNYAYLAIGYDIKPGYVFIVDISNPSQPREVARITGKGYAGFTAVEVDESSKVLYAFEYRAMLHAYDISKPSYPVELGSFGKDKGLGYLGPGSDMKIRGDYAYFSAFYEGIRIVDISDPRNMTLAAKGRSSDRFGYVHNILLNGNYAYIANMGGGFSIFNISTPTKPKYVIQVDTHGLFYDVWVIGKYAYVSADYEVMIFDISNPSNPVHMGSVEWARAGIGAIKGNYLFIDGGWRPLAVVDISNPRSPKIVNKYGDHMKVAGILGNTMFVGHHGEIQALDISHLPNLTLISKIAVKTTNTYPPGVLLNNNLLYVYFGSDIGLKVYDVSDPAKMKELSTIYPWDGGALMANGNYLYGITGYYLNTYDISNPAKPQKINSLRHNGAWNIGGAYGFTGNAFYKNYLVRNEARGLILWDITDPAKPRDGELVTLPGGVSGVYFVNDTVYSAISFKGLYIGNFPNEISAGDNIPS